MKIIDKELDKLCLASGCGGYGDLPEWQSAGGAKIERSKYLP